MIENVCFLLKLDFKTYMKEYVHYCVEINAYFVTNKMHFMGKIFSGLFKCLNFIPLTKM